MSTAQIQINGISKRYTMGTNTLLALDNVSLTINAGEFIAIMGPSGSGKSTLMNVLGLLDPPNDGEFLLMGESTKGQNEEELAHRRTETIGFIFQQFHLLKRTSALDNVALPLIYSHQVAPDRAKELLGRVGLGDRLHHNPNELSGGQQQRVAIARALINQPQIILADEPTGNLDSKSQEEIMALLKALNEEGITIIVVTHEEEVAHHAKRIIRMKDGKILSDTTNSTQTTAVPRIPKPQEITKSTQFLFKTHFKEALKSIASNKLRTFLSVLGIFIGVAAVITMLALGKGAQEAIADRLASLGSNLLTVRTGSNQSGGVSLGGGSVSRLTLADNKALKSMAHVVKTCGSVNGRSQVEAEGHNYNTQVLGIETSYASMRSIKPSSGRFFTEEEDKTRAKVALVGTTVLKNIFGESSGGYENIIGKYIKINRIYFQVIGILPEKGATSFRDEDDVILIPLTTAMRRVLGKVYLNNIDLQIDTTEAIPDSQDLAKSILNERHQIRVKKTGDEAFEIRNLSEIQETIAATNKTMSTLLAIIASISLLVGGIGIMNIMLVSVTERTREIGLRKAIGATPKDILFQFLIEASTMSVLGGFLGISLSYGISLLISKLSGWNLHITATSVIVSTIFSAGIGITFGLWPARKAAGLNPIDALRYE